MTVTGGAATPFLPFAHGSTSPSWRPRTSSAAGWRRPAVPSRTGQIATISPEEATATSRKASCGHAAPAALFARWSGRLSRRRARHVASTRARAPGAAVGRTYLPSARARRCPVDWRDPAGADPHADDPRELPSLQRAGRDHGDSIAAMPESGSARGALRLCHPLDQPRATLFDLEAAAPSRVMKISRHGSVGKAPAPPVD